MVSVTNKYAENKRNGERGKETNKQRDNNQNKMTLNCLMSES